MKTAYFHYEFDYAHRLDIGKVRPGNEDRVFTNPEIGFFGVSDGIGGAKYGEKTAEMVSSSVPKAVETFLNENGSNISPQKAEEGLIEAIEKVSDVVYELDNKIGAREYGATISCTLLVDRFAVFGNVGDSRGYLMRNGALYLLTEDDNYANIMVKSGEMTEEQVKRHPFLSTALTKYIGMKPARPHTAVVGLEKGDKILLCSDGLHGMLSDEEITDIMWLPMFADDTAELLKDAANAAGGQDNISVIIIEITM